MRTPHHRIILTLATLALAATVLPAPATAAARRPFMDASRWIVALRDAAPAPAFDARGRARTGARALADARAAAADVTVSALEAELGFRASRRYGYAIRGFAARLTERQVAALRDDPRVRALMPDAVVHVEGRRVGGEVRSGRVRPASSAQVVPTGVRRIGADTVAPLDLAAVNVAVVDTGIGTWDATNETWVHEGELRVAGGVDAYSTWGGACGSRVSAPSRWADTNASGHGTHVAGTIGAIDNDIGVVGVAPGASLWSVRVFRNNDGSIESIICGLDWIAGHNASAPAAQRIDIVNMSLVAADLFSSPSTGCNDPDGIEPLEQAVCDVAKSAIVIVASGNASDLAEGYVPARYRAVLTVTAIADYDGRPGSLAPGPTCGVPGGDDPDDTFATFANYGPEVDIAAPGVCITSTGRASIDATAVLNGTSMATPHVSGAAARYLHEHPGATLEELRQRLIRSAGYGWRVATDPNADPTDTARLLDLTALLSPTPGLRLTALPGRITLSPVVEGDGAIGLQRIGGYAGDVTLTATDVPAAVDTVTLDPVTLPGSAGGTGSVVGRLAVGVAPGTADGQLSMGVRATGTGGSYVDDATFALDVDATPPTIAGPWPFAVLREGVLRAAAPLRLSYTVGDAVSGVTRVSIQRSPDGTSWSAAPTTRVSSESAEVTVDTGGPVKLRVRAVDAAGNTGLSSPLDARVRVIESTDQVLGRSSGWATRSASSASSANLLSTTGAGRVLTATVEGRGIAVVAVRGKDKGRFRISIDGAPVATVFLASGGLGPRKIVYASGPLTDGVHVVTIRTLRGSVDIDAILVLG